MASALGIDLLGEEPESPGRAEQPLTECPRPAGLADFTQGGDEPERADRERSLLAMEAVVGLVHEVAQHEAALRQVAFDGEDRVAHAGIVWWQEPQQRDQQQRGVERVGLVMLAEDPVLDAALEDLLVEAVGKGGPASGEAFLVE